MLSYVDGGLSSTIALFCDDFDKVLSGSLLMFWEIVSVSSEYHMCEHR
jgi:hypothetical protein